MRHMFVACVFCALLTFAKASFASEQYTIELTSFESTELLEMAPSPLLTTGLLVVGTISVLWNYFMPPPTPEEADECMICLQIIKDENDGIDFPCGHRIVHYGDCLDGYLKGWSVCPKCQV